MKVAAWAGGIIVIAGIALFARYAVSEGWFGGMSPMGKLALSYAAAAALGSAGLLLRRQLGRLASAALVASGIGGCYVATCAGVRPFEVMDPVVALVISALLACAGAWLTLRSREVVVAAISLLGAYLVPIFALPGAIDFDASHGTATFSGGYYTAIFAVVLLSARMGQPIFANLRSMAILQAMVAGLMVVQLRDDAPLTTSVLLVLWWAMAALECTLAAFRGSSPRGNAAFLVGATVVATPFAVVGALSSNPWTAPFSWVPAAIGLACLAGAVVVGAPVPMQRVDDADRREDPQGAAVADACRLLAAIFAVLVAVEAVAQVGVLVRGGALPVTWAAMGATMAIASRRLGMRPIAWIGLLTMFPAFLVALVQLFFGSSSASTLVVWGAPVPHWDLTPKLTSWHIEVTDGVWSPLLVCVILAVTARWWNTLRRATAMGPAGAAVPIGTAPHGAMELPAVGGAIAALGASILWCALSLACASGYASMSLALLGGLAVAALGTGGALARAVAFIFLTVAGCAWYLALGATIVEPMASGSLAGAVAVAAISLAILGLFAAREGNPWIAQRIFGAFAAHALLCAALLVGAWSVVGRAHGSGADPQAPLEWGALALATLGGLACLGCRGDRWSVVRTVGRVGVVTAAFLAVLASVGRAFTDPGKDTWLQHWLLDMGTPATIVSLVALVLVRGDGRVSRSPMTGAAVVGAVAVVASVIARFFEPTARPPFPASPAMQGAAVSAWMGVAGLALVIVGFRASSGPMRWIGLVGLALTAAKVLLYDMSDAGPAWRVGAMVVTGILIVGSSAVYARATRVVDAKKAAGGEPVPPGGA